LPKHAPLLWALYPVAYLAYALVRGKWKVESGNAAGLLLRFVAVGTLLRLAARRR
jgi:hypothetical protein